MSVSAVKSEPYDGSAEPVEDLKQRIRELEHRCERFENIIEKSSICTKIISLDRQLHFMSCAGHQALKIPDITEFYNKLYPPVGFDADLSELYDEHFSLALSGQATSFECPIPDMEGRKEWYITNLIPMYDDDGELEFVLASSANITDRKDAEFAAEALHKHLLKSSRAAGMAEVATGVLHNVGNTLNSTFVSAELIQEKARHLKTSNLVRVVEMLEAHKDDLSTYLSEDAKGAKILPYLKMLSENLAKEQEDIVEEAKELRERLEHVRVIVGRQQQYAKATFAVEQCAVKPLIEESLGLLGAEYEESDINIAITTADDLPEAGVDRHMVTQILVNLLHNARDALSEVERPEKKVRVHACLSGTAGFHIRVEDNGLGVPEENTDKIFQYGFTTKERGNGFGLHNASNLARTMGGSLTCRSDGYDRGAVFTLELPLQMGAGVAPLHGMEG